MKLFRLLYNADRYSVLQQGESSNKPGWTTANLDDNDMNKGRTANEDTYN